MMETLRNILWAAGTALIWLFVILFAWYVLCFVWYRLVRITTYAVLVAAKQFKKENENEQKRSGTPRET